MKQVSIVKRAFEIAPECRSIAEVKRRLIREGHYKVNKELSGWQIRRKLIAALLDRHRAAGSTFQSLRNGPRNFSVGG